MGQYGKLAVAVVTAVVMFLFQATADDQPLSVYELIQVISAGVGAFLVWLTANGPKGSAWNFAKTFAYGLTAVLAVLLTTLPNGITTHEVFELIIAFAGGAGVLVVGGAPVHDAGTVVVPAP